MESKGLSYAVVGAGFNVYPPTEGFPDAIKGIAGTIFRENPTNR